MKLSACILALWVLCLSGTPSRAEESKSPCDPCSKELSFVCDCFRAFLSGDRQAIEKCASQDANFLTKERLKLISEFIETHNLKDCGSFEVVGRNTQGNKTYLDLYDSSVNRSFDVVLEKSDVGQYRLRSIFFSSHFGKAIQ